METATRYLRWATQFLCASAALATLGMILHSFSFFPSPSFGFNLRLMSWGDGTGVRASGTNLVVVGTDNHGLLHIRIFDADGRRVTDTDETKLPRTQATAIVTLKQQLPGLLPPHYLTDDERQQVVREATSIVGLTPSFHFGLAEIQIVIIVIIFLLYYISPYIGLERLGTLARGRFWTTAVYLLGAIVVAFMGLSDLFHLFHDGMGSPSAAMAWGLILLILPLFQWFRVIVMAGVVLLGTRLLEKFSRRKTVAKLSRDDDLGA